MPRRSLSVEQYGVERFLEELGDALRAGKYRPQRGAAPVHPEGRREAAAAGDPDGAGPRGADGGEAGAGADLRGGLPAVLVRLPARSGARRWRWRPCASAGRKGGNHVLDADIRDYFGSIDHEQADGARGATRLGPAGAQAAAAVARSRCDGGRARDAQTLAGTPQGGVISPLLSNIYLHVLDERVDTRQCAQLGTLVRYADDFVVMCDTRRTCEEAEQRVSDDPRAARARAASGQDEASRALRGQAGLRLPRLSPAQAHERADLGEGRASASTSSSAGRRSAAMKRVRQRVKELTGRSGTMSQDVARSSRDLNPVLRGWGNYFRTGNAARQVQPARRLRRGGGSSACCVKRKGRNLTAGRRPNAGRATSSTTLGLHRLRGTVRYPEAA